MRRCSDFSFLTLIFFTLATMAFPQNNSLKRKATSAFLPSYFLSIPSLPLSLTARFYSSIPLLFPATLYINSLPIHLLSSFSTNAPALSRYKVLHELNKSNHSEHSAVDLFPRNFPPLPAPLLLLVLEMLQRQEFFKESMAQVITV